LPGHLCIQGLKGMSELLICWPSLMTWCSEVFEMLDCNSVLKRLMAREDFITFSHRESLKSYLMTRYSFPILSSMSSLQFHLSLIIPFALPATPNGNDEILALMIQNCFRRPRHAPFECERMS
jgi:hypothetical protein